MVAIGTAPGTAAAEGLLPLRTERRIGAGVVAAAAVVLLLASQLHHEISPKTSDGAVAEILPVVISGLLAWAVIFGAALVPPHRAGSVAATARRYALGLGLFGLPSVLILYWTPIPWCLGVAALLLVRRARALAGPARTDSWTRVLAWIAIAGPLVIFVGVLLHALS